MRCKGRTHDLISDDDRRRIARRHRQGGAHDIGRDRRRGRRRERQLSLGPVLWAALAALAVPWPLIHWTWWPIQTSTSCSWPSSPCCWQCSCRCPLRLALTPRSLKHDCAHRRALEQFLAQNLHTTVGRTGVLIFVSVAERYAEVLADAAIHERVPQAVWRSIVDDLTDALGKGDAAEGFVRAIGAVGEQLARHFPPDARPHTLTNHLIVLPAA